MAIQSTELVAHESGSHTAELVFGSIDGLLTVLGIVSAAGSASLAPQQIFTTALGGTVAGSLSIFAATYLSETTERKTRILEALKNSKNHSAKSRTRKNRPNSQEIDHHHPRIRRLFSKIHRRAIASGLTIATTSAFFSLLLLLPLVFLPRTYSITASLSLGIFLLLLLGAVRGLTLKQSAAKSAVKMLLLGIVIVLASRAVGSYVQKLIHP